MSMKHRIAPCVAILALYFMAATPVQAQQPATNAPWAAPCDDSGGALIAPAEIAQNPAAAFKSTTPASHATVAPGLSGLITPFELRRSCLESERLINLGLMADQPAESAGSAPAGGGDTQELAKKLSNPIANLISVPFQFNYDEGFGPRDAGRFLLNVQPVIPISLNDDWNVIIRTIVPVIYQDSPASGVESKFGMGDIVQSFFFSPKEGEWVWGVGPVFLWPTATSDLLGSEQWGAGPTAVVLKQGKGWTYGALANHIWSYAGNDDRADVNATFLQPFISYSWPTATTLSFNTESTYDWTANEWTVPLNLAISQVMKIGGQPISLALGARYYADSPDGGPEWGIRFTFTLLFPK